MSYHTDDKNESGSVTIEVAVVMPAFLGVLLFFISLFQITAAENILNMTTLKTADKMCKWAPIYKNLIADNLQNKVLDEISIKTDGSFVEILNNELDDFILGVFDLRKIGEYSFNYIYGFSSQKICESNIKENALIKNDIVKIKNLNLYKSEFFGGDSNNIRIKAVCEVDTFLPFDVTIAAEATCAAWGSGVMPHIYLDDTTDTDTSNESVWKKDNFTRGQIIRKIYGGNLPETFPVISAFEKGTATMIKSLDHTASTYNDSSVFGNVIKNMIDSLAAFKGGTAGNITVKEKDVLCRRLLLVMPENELEIAKQKSLEYIMRYATSKLVVIDLQRYQKV